MMADSKRLGLLGRLAEIQGPNGEPGRRFDRSRNHSAWAALASTIASETRKPSVTRQAPAAPVQPAVEAS